MAYALKDHDSRLVKMLAEHDESITEMLERRDKGMREYAASEAVALEDARRSWRRRLRRAQDWKPRRGARAPEPASSASAQALALELEPPADFICPITAEAMRDPVMAGDGHAYERIAIERWLAIRSTSPLTGKALENTGVFPNHMLRRQIREWQERSRST